MIPFSHRFLINGGLVFSALFTLCTLGCGASLSPSLIKPISTALTHPASGTPRSSTLNTNPTAAKPTPTPSAQSAFRGFNGDFYAVMSASCILAPTSMGDLIFNENSTASKTELNFSGMVSAIADYWFYINFQDDQMIWDDIPLSSTVAANVGGNLCVVTHTSHVSFTAVDSTLKGSLNIKDIVATTCASDCPANTCANLTKDQFANYLIGKTIPFTVLKTGELSSIGLFSSINDACLPKNSSGNGGGVQLQMEYDPFAY